MSEREQDKILFVCTANICRSPMAEAMLRHEAAVRGRPLAVASAGVRAVRGSGAASGSREAVSALGHDLTLHRSRPVSEFLVGEADLILTMEVRHLVDLVSGRPELFARTFTLREIVRRCPGAGPRSEQPMTQWLADVGSERRAADLMRATDLDVADPYGGSPTDYHACARELRDLVASLAGWLWGPKDAT